MLGQSPVIAFAATANPNLAREFYEDTVGLRLVADEPFALVFELPGATLRVAKVERVQPPPYTILGWVVLDIDATADALHGQGVTFERFQGMDQDERGISTLPGGARVGWFKDPDGNLLSITQAHSRG